MLVGCIFLRVMMGCCVFLSVMLGFCDKMGQGCVE